MATSIDYFVQRCAFMDVRTEASVFLLVFAPARWAMMVIGAKPNSSSKSKVMYIDNC